MSIYFGLVIISPIQNQQKYSQIILEIEQYLSLHKSDIIYIDQPNIIRFKSFEGSSEFCLPKSCNFLYTIYYRIHQDEEEDFIEVKQKYIDIVWECLCVIKENFPSKVELSQENLDNFDSVHWQREILRRQLNILQARIQQNISFKKDEIEDVFSLIENCQRQSNVRGLQICLSALHSDLIQPLQLTNLDPRHIQLLENIVEEVYFQAFSQRSDIIFKDIETSKNVASIILGKILKCKQSNKNYSKTNRATAIYELRQNPKFGALVPSNQTQLSPSLMISLEFQLKESHDIERLCFILDLLVNRSSLMMENMRQRGFSSIIFGNVISGYCNGDYGIDNSDLTRFCVFHGLLFKCSSKIIDMIGEDSDQFTQWIQEDNRLNNTLQIVEESILNWVNLALNLNEEYLYEDYSKCLMEVYLPFNILKFYSRFESLSSKSIQSQLKDHYVQTLQLICQNLGFNTQRELVKTIYENLQEIQLVSQQLAQFVEFLLSL